MSQLGKVVSAFLVLMGFTAVTLADSGTRVTIQGKVDGEALTLSLEVGEGSEARPMMGALVRSMPSGRLVLVQWDAESIGESLREEIKAEGPAAMVESKPGDSFPRVKVRWESSGDDGFQIEAIYANGEREVISAARVANLEQFGWTSTITGSKMKAKR